MHLLIGMVILFLFISAAMWIGFYVVLPIFLLSLLVSGVAAIFRLFRPECALRPIKDAHMDKVIDVDFEEIN